MKLARFEFSPVELAEKAASAGRNDALFQLGLMYSAGRDVETDLVAAHKWFNLAALRGNVEARRYRTELADSMTREEIAAAQREARVWLSTH